jgi:hypothetical protein
MFSLGMGYLNSTLIKEIGGEKSLLQSIRTFFNAFSKDFVSVTNNAYDAVGLGDMPLNAKFIGLFFITIFPLFLVVLGYIFLADEPTSERPISDDDHDKQE